MGSVHSWKDLRSLLAGLVLLALGSEALAQYGPRPVLFRPPPSGMSGGGDAFPLIVGVLVFLAILIGIIGCVILPVVSKLMGLQPHLGICCALAAPVSIALLYTVWQPLHLTTVCQWGCAGGMGLLILGILAAVVWGFFRGAYSLFCTNNSPDTDGSQSFFMVVAIGLGTTILNIKTTWGFWLSLLGAVLGFFAVVLVIACILDMVKWAIKK